MKRRLRILLAGDQYLVREGTRRLLEDHGGLDVAELPGTGIVMLTEHEYEVYVWRLLAQGVAGYGYLHKVRVGDVYRSRGLCASTGFAHAFSSPLGLEDARPRDSHEAVPCVP